MVKEEKTGAVEQAPAVLTPSGAEVKESVEQPAPTPVPPSIPSSSSGGDSTDEDFQLQTDFDISDEEDKNETKVIYID